MNCQHEWTEREPLVEDDGQTTRITEWHGVRCGRCLVLRGVDQGACRITIQHQDHATSDVPSWLKGRIKEPGVVSLRAPFSMEVHREALEWVEAGHADGVFQHDRRRNVWRVTELSGPNIVPGKDVVGELRQRVLIEAPEAEVWLRGAPRADLEVAAAITARQEWRSLEWPARVWNATVHGDSKEGNVARVARQLGLKVPERGYALWFYGEGVLSNGKERIVVSGETCVLNTWFTEHTSVHAHRVGIVENRDLASVIDTDGIILALDGQPTRAQRQILRACQGKPAWAWFDVDGEGIGMARAIRSILDIEVIGFDALDTTLGLPLPPEKRVLALSQLEVVDDLRPIVERILQERLWWEQEALWASGKVDVPARGGERPR